MTYDASSITVLTPSEAAERFWFEKIRVSLPRGSIVSPAGCERLLAACYQVGEDWDRVCQRYIHGDKGVEVSEEFRAAYAEIVLSERRGGR